jgi:hypothetical protein
MEPSGLFPDTIKNGGNWSLLFWLLLCYLAACCVIDLLLLARYTCNINITYGWIYFCNLRSISIFRFVG